MAMSGALGEHATLGILLVTVKSSRPSRTSQKRVRSSEPAVANPFPSWENAMEIFQTASFVRRDTTCPVAEYNSFTVRSELATAMRCPSGDQAISRIGPDSRKVFN